MSSRRCAAIIADVAARGDAALIELTAEIRPRRPRRHRPAGDAGRARRRDRGLRRRRARCAASSRATASRPITAASCPKDDRWTDPLGVELGHRWTAIEAVGLYVPGGTAAYPSSVLMNAVPAKVAGCPRVVMVVPAPDGKLNPLVLAAAKLAGVDEIYRVGGAQAVAALAYGTATIAPVAKIVGPGNAYVAAAKRLVFGKVGIDMIAGPSEVLIIADRDANPGLDRRRPAGAGRARHRRAVDPDHRRCGARRRGRARGRGPAQDAAARRRSRPPRGAISAPSSWSRELDDAVPLTDAIAPEHLEIETHDAERLVGEDPQCRRDLPRQPHAGSDRRLCGGLEPRAADRALGALLVGPRRARLHEAHLDPAARRRTRSRKLGPAAIALGEAEGLDAHARSVAMRLNRR